MLRLTEIVLLAAGVALLAAYAGARAHGDAGRRDAIAAFEAARPAPARVDARPSLEAAPPDQIAWSDSRRAAYAATAPAGTALALLRIDAVGLEVPVFDGTGERELNRGAGHIAGTALPGAVGNVGIAAHRDGWFRALEDVVPGDEVELVTLTERRRFRVTDLAVVDPTDVGVLAPTDGSVLTLVTCYPFYFVGSAPQRYIVRAVAIN